MTEPVVVAEHGVGIGLFIFRRTGPPPMDFSFDPLRGGRRILHLEQSLIL